MITFILILLLIAAIFGVLGAVLKIAFILVLSFALAVAVMVLAGWWWVRNRMRAFEREWQRRAQEDERRRGAVDIRSVRNEADDHDPPELGDGTS